MDVKVRFKESGDSPEIGKFAGGDIFILPAPVAEIFISRGIAEKMDFKKSLTNKEKEAQDGRE